MLQSVRRSAFDTAIIAASAVVLLALIFPFLWVVLTSIRPTSELFTNTFVLISRRLTLSSYAHLLHSNFVRYILNSVIVCSISTVATVLVALLAAYSFSRHRFPGKSILLGSFALTQLFPFVILVTPLYILFWHLHLVNTYLGLILTYVAITLPFCVYMLLGYFRSVPMSLDEAARIDGAGTLTVIFRVVLPVAWPGLVATAIYVFVQSWNEYLFALTFMTEDSRKTIPVGLADFFGQYTTDWGAVMSASVISTLPTLIFFAIMQKQLVSGLAAGAVKQ